jgi:hypothetical protein
MGIHPLLVLQPGERVEVEHDVPGQVRIGGPEPGAGQLDAPGNQCQRLALAGVHRERRPRIQERRLQRPDVEGALRRGRPRIGRPQLGRQIRGRYGVRRDDAFGLPHEHGATGVGQDAIAGQDPQPFGGGLVLQLAV